MLSLQLNEQDLEALRERLCLKTGDLNAGAELYELVLEWLADSQSRHSPETMNQSLTTSGDVAREADNPTYQPAAQGSNPMFEG